MEPYQPSLMRLIALLRDGEYGFRELGEQVASVKCQLHLVEESSTRAAYAEQLEPFLRPLPGTAGIPFHAPEGTPLGTVHRRWIDLRSAWGAQDPDLLQMLDVCESTARAAYADLLEAPALPSALRAILEAQLAHVQYAAPRLQILCFGPDRPAVQAYGPPVAPQPETR